MVVLEVVMKSMPNYINLNYVCAASGRCSYNNVCKNCISASLQSASVWRSPLLYQTKSPSPCGVFQFCGLLTLLIFIIEKEFNLIVAQFTGSAHDKC